MKIQRSVQTAILNLVVVHGMVGCATIHTESSVTSTVVGTRDVQGPGRDRRLTASVTEAQSAFELAVASAETCTVQKVNVVRRTRATRRSLQDRAVVAAEYGLGGAALLGGLGVTYDAQNVPAANDPMETNPVGRNGAYGIGIGLVSAGIAALVVAVINTRAARDSVEDDGKGTTPVEGNGGRDISCNPQSASAVQLGLVGSGERTLDVGTTDRDGKLTIKWQSIPGDWLRSSSWVQAARLVGPEGSDVASISLAKARAAAADGEWTVVQKATSSEPIKKFREDFSESHQDEATRLYVTIRANEIDREIATAVGAKDLKRATTLLDEWQRLAPESTSLAGRRREFDAVARDVHLANYRKEFDTSLAAAMSNKGVSVESFQTAAARLADLGSLVPPDPLHSQRAKQLEQARRKLIASVISTANRSAARGEFDEALASLASAKVVGPDEASLRAAETRVARQKDAAAEREERKKIADDKAAERRKDCAMKCLQQQSYQADCAAQNAGRRGGLDLGYELCAKSYRCACAKRCGLKVEPIYNNSCP